MLKKRSAAVSIFAAVVLSFSTGAENSAVSGHWVSAWSAARHAPLPFPGLPPSPAFENQTIRMVVSPTVGGERLRIRFWNALGTTAPRIGAAHIALASVNHWIRGSGAFDGISAAGYKAMANAVDLTMLRNGVSASTKK